MICIIFILPQSNNPMVKKGYNSLLLVIVISFLSFIPAKSTLFPYKDSRITYHGRYYVDQSGLRYDWSCFVIQFCFSGANKVFWTGQDKFGHYLIISNNTKESFIPKHQQKVAIYQNTKQTTLNTCISIHKITEDHYGPLGTKKDAIFKGIQLIGNNVELRAKTNNFKYKLQFVGDSITTGFGDMSGNNPICFSKLRGNRNCYESWAVKLSQKLDSQYRIVAESGKGVVKNQFGVAGAPMPVLFTKITSNSKPNSYHFQDLYKPDAIIFNLGANDYSNLIKPGENNFIFGYEKMLTQSVNVVVLNLGYQPKIISFCHVDFPKHVCDYVQEAVHSFRFSYDKVYYVEVPAGAYTKDNAGCIGHPNIKGHQFIVDSIYEKIKYILQN